jgi:hypothetical protein
MMNAESGRTLRDRGLPHSSREIEETTEIISGKSVLKYDLLSQTSFQLAHLSDSLSVS